MDITFYLKKRNCRIAVPHGAQQKIAERFGVGRSFVCQALRHAKNSKLAREIRKVAMGEFGGAFERLKVKDHADGAEPSINVKL